MTQVILALVAAVLLSTTAIQPGKQGSDRTRRNKKVPEGVIVEGKQARLKDDYKFIRNNKNNVAVARMRSGEVTGEFNCTCLSSKTGGGCEVTIAKKIIYCSNGSCSGECELGAVIKDPGIVK